MRIRKLDWLAGVAMAAALVLGHAATPVAAATPAAAQQPPVRVGSFSGAYLAGRAAEADNDLASAIDYYQQALTADPDNQALQQSLMLALIAKGRFDDALPLADKLKSVTEIERVSRLALAIDAFRRNAFADAQNMLMLAPSSDLDRLITGIMTAWAKLGAGSVDDAVAHLSSFSGPEWYGLFLGIHTAMILEQGGRTQEADQAYDRVVVTRSAADVAPEAYVRAVESYAGFLARAGRKDDALNALRRVDEFAPMRPATIALRADIAAGKPIPPMVATPREGAAEILLNIASALNRSGGEAFVRLYLQFARVLWPKNDSVLMQLGGVAEQQRNLEEAIDFYGQVEAISPMKRSAELQLGLNLAELERKDEAVKHLQALIDQDPADMRGYLALGGVHSAAEDFRAAADVYDKAAARLKNPVKADWTIFYQRGIAHERLKEWDKAEPNFRKALELFPNQPQVLNYLGYSWIDMNRNLEEGLEMIKKAVELRPSDGFIIDSLGWGYYKLGRFEEAVTELERAVSLQPADPVLNDHLGDAYWRVGRRLEATFQWNHARDLKPTPEALVVILEKLKNGLPEEQRTEVATLVAGVGDAAPATDAAPQAPEPVKAAAAAAPAPAAPAPAGPYTVQPGETLWSIAHDRLGDGNRFREIMDLNGLRDPDRIYPGQELKLP